MTRFSKLFDSINSSYVYAFLGEATLGLTLILYIVLARIIGPEKYGIFSSAVVLGGVLSVFIRIGIPNFLAREIAANPIEGTKVLSSAIVIELVNALVVIGLLFPIAYLLGFKGEGLFVCYLIVLSEICRSIKQTLRAVCRGLGDFRIDSISVTLERFFVVLLSGIVLFWTQSLLWFVGTFVFARFLDIVGLLLYHRKRGTFPFSASIFFRIPEIVKATLPFALSSTLWILYYQVDILMLKGFSNIEEVGYYGAAYRILEIFSAVPRVIFYVSFVKFAKSHANQPSKISSDIFRTIQLLLVTTVPLALVAGFWQGNLVHYLYGDAYTASIVPLSILLSSLGIKIFANFHEHFFQATGHERVLPVMLGLTVLVNVLLNSILIPRMGASGAAIATLASELVMAFAGCLLMLYLGDRQLGKHLGLLCIISLVTSSVPLLIFNGLNVFFGIALLSANISLLSALVRPKYFTQVT